MGFAPFLEIEKRQAVGLLGLPLAVWVGFYGFGFRALAPNLRR